MRSHGATGWIGRRQVGAQLSFQSGTVAVSFLSDEFEPKRAHTPSSQHAPPWGKTTAITTPNALIRAFESDAERICSETGALQIGSSGHTPLAYRPALN
jgi:hypothetical protein